MSWSKIPEYEWTVWRMIDFRQDWQSYMRERGLVFWGRGSRRKPVEIHLEERHGEVRVRPERCLLRVYEEPKEDHRNDKR